MNIENAKVLVTGGSQGIGLCIAEHLKNAGAQVVVAARNADRLESVATEKGMFSCTADVSDEKQVENLFSQTVSILGGLDVVINNAAYGYFSPLVDIEFEKFERLLKTNLSGAMLVGREAARYFKKQNSGNIVNISSTAGLGGFQNGTAYVATKFALKGMTECWRAELRPYNVRVMLVNPSEVQTEFVVNSGRDRRPFNPTKLLADDIAHTVLSMLSLNDRAFVTEATVWATNPRDV